MAKAAKKSKTKSEHKYGVETLAKDLGLEPTSVRVQLRNKGVKKAKDGVYGWDSQDEYLKAKAKLDRKGKSADKKPAKKAAKKKVTKKAPKSEDDSGE